MSTRRCVWQCMHVRISGSLAWGLFTERRSPAVVMTGPYVEPLQCQVEALHWHVRKKKGTWDILTKAEMFLWVHQSRNLVLMREGSASFCLKSVTTSLVLLTLMTSYCPDTTVRSWASSPRLPHHWCHRHTFRLSLTAQSWVYTEHCSRFIPRLSPSSKSLMMSLDGRTFSIQCSALIHNPKYSSYYWQACVIKHEGYNILFWRYENWKVSGIRVRRLLWHLQFSVQYIFPLCESIALGK